MELVVLDTSALDAVVEESPLLANVPEVLDRHVVSSDCDTTPGRVDCVPTTVEDHVVCGDLDAVIGVIYVVASDVLGNDVPPRLVDVRTRCDLVRGRRSASESGQPEDPDRPHGS